MYVCVYICTYVRILLSSTPVRLHGEYHDKVDAFGLVLKNN